MRVSVALLRSEKSTVYSYAVSGSACISLAVFGCFRPASKENKTERPVARAKLHRPRVSSTWLTAEKQPTLDIRPVKSHIPVSEKCGDGLHAVDSASWIVLVQKKNMKLSNPYNTPYTKHPIAQHISHREPRHEGTEPSPRED